jgi:hypothetical protein
MEKDKQRNPAQPLSSHLDGIGNPYWSKDYRRKLESPPSEKQRRHQGDECEQEGKTESFSLLNFPFSDTCVKRKKLDKVDLTNFI